MGEQVWKIVLFFLSKDFSAILIAIFLLGIVKRPKSQARLEEIGERVERGPRTRRRTRYGERRKTIIQKISQCKVNEINKKICLLHGLSQRVGGGKVNQSAFPTGGTSTAWAKERWVRKYYLGLLG